MLTNIVVGPGIVGFPRLYQQSGYLLCTGCIILFSLLALANGWMTLYSHTALGKRHGKRLEFIDMCQIVFPKAVFLVCFVFYVLTLLALCVTSIIQVWQLMDFVIGRLGGGTICALEIYPKLFHYQCGQPSMDSSSAFQSDSIVISLGYALCALITVPFGFFPLEENVGYQVVACCLMFVAIAVWIVSFGVRGLDPQNVPVIGESASSLVGVTLFNFSMPFTLPSWNNERRLEVSPMKSMGCSILLGSVSMVLLGLIAGMSLPIFFDTDGTLLTMINAPENNFSWPAVGAMYVFTLMNTATGIPVFSIVLRYNFMSTTNPVEFLRGEKRATCLAVLLPWICSIFLYTGDGFTTLLSFAGTCLQSVVNFIIPVLMFIAVLRAERGCTPECRVISESDYFFPQISSKRHRKFAKVCSVLMLILMAFFVTIGIWDSFNEN